MTQHRRNCFYCQCAFNTSDPTSDAYPTREHKQPKSRGGARTGSNVTRACKRCNNEKGDMTVKEYREYLEVTKGIAGRTMRQIHWRKHRAAQLLQRPAGWSKLVIEDAAE